MIGVLQARKGVRLQSAVITMNAATVANPFTIFQLSNFAQMVGVSTFRIKRVKGLNVALANTNITFGRGLAGAFVAMMPPLLTLNGLNFDFVEADLPEVEWNTDMTAWVAVATVMVQVEIEEIK